MKIEKGGEEDNCIFNKGETEIYWQWQSNVNDYVKYY